ncbi:MAG: hypothetical protein ACPGVP_06615 [Thiolinea sp.]
MVVRPGEFPGSHERHFIRKVNNPLFEAEALVPDDAGLLNAQQLDHDLLLVFLSEFRELLQETGALDGNTDSDTVLALKDRLDRAYETASAVADDQQHSKQSIQRLLGIIMAAVRRGAGDDIQALQELEQEQSAREAHFELLKSQLVADLLNPRSVITAQELVPTLLSADKDDILLAVQLFDTEQLEVLLGHGAQLLERMNGDFAEVITGARERLYLIQGYLEFLRSHALSE